MSRIRRRCRSYAAIALLSLALLGSEVRAEPGLSRDGDVLLYDGEPTTLVAYGCYGILTESSFDYATFFDTISGYGINFVRVWGNYHWTNDLIPFAGTRNDANLTALSPAYLQRLHDLVAAAAARHIVVMFTFWDSVCLEGSDTSGNRWINCPYRDANNSQSYCTTPQQFDDVPPDTSPPIWQESHEPYMTAVVDTLGDFPNVIYEIMNEPYPGYGDQAFHDHAIAVLYDLLHQPGYSGSKLIATNDGSLSNAGNPKVDVVSFHLSSPSGADDHNGLAKPVIISNDGDDSQTSNSIPDVSARAARVGQIASLALGSGAKLGHNHVEILDKDIYGASWLSQDYDPKPGNVTVPILQTLAPWAKGLPDYECPAYDAIIDDQDGAPGFTLTGDDWATWGSAGCGFDASDTSYHYLSETVGGADRRGTAIWTPALPEAGIYEISTWWRKTGNRTTDADHFVYDGAGGETHVVFDQKGDAPADENSPIEYDCFSGWVSLGEHYCDAGEGGCVVVLDGTDDDGSDEANAMRFRLLTCTADDGGGDTGPDPSEACAYPGAGGHVAKVFGEGVTGNGWENMSWGTGAPDGLEAHSPNVEEGEILRATFPQLCDPDGEERIDWVEVAIDLRTQYESGTYDVLLRFHAEGAASLITHHTTLKWDALDVTGDRASWSWADAGALRAVLQLEEHPQGHIDSDVWVDAFRLRVGYTTAPPECADGELRCGGAQGDDIERCDVWHWVADSTCPYGCESGACLGPPVEDPGPEPAAEPEPEPMPEPLAEATAELPPEPEPEPAPEPAPEPTPEPWSDASVQPEVLPQDAPGPDIATEPDPNPEPEPEPVGCTPDERRCRGAIVEICTLDGSHWAHYQSCAGDETCSAGLCVPLAEEAPTPGEKDTGCGAAPGGPHGGPGALPFALLMWIFGLFARSRRRRP